MTTTRPTPIDKFTVWCALDNHEPTRGYMRSTVETYKRHNQTELTYVLAIHEEFHKKVFDKKVFDGPLPIFLLDDGEIVKPLYVIGYPALQTEVFLAPLPTNPGGELKRPNGEPVDFRNWWLGPRTAYHLKAYE